MTVPLLDGGNLGVLATGRACVKQDVSCLPRNCREFSSHCSPSVSKVAFKASESGRLLMGVLKSGCATPVAFLKEEETLRMVGGGNTAWRGWGSMFKWQG